MNRTTGILIASIALLAALMGGAFFFWDSLSGSNQQEENLTLDDNTADEGDAESDDADQDQAEQPRQAKPSAPDQVESREIDENDYFIGKGDSEDSKPVDPSELKPVELEGDSYPNKTDSIQIQEPQVDPEQEPFEFTIVVSGRVVDGSKQGIAGASVSVTPAEPSDRNWGWGRGGTSEASAKILKLAGESTTSGGDGNFTLRLTGTAQGLIGKQASIESAKVQINAEAGKSGLLSFQSSAIDVTVKNGQAQVDGVELPLHQAGSISGRVVEKGDPQTPFPNAQVTLSYTGNWNQDREGGVRLARPDSKTVTTGEDGTFSFTGLHPGGYSLSASIPQSARRSGVNVVIRGGGGSSWNDGSTQWVNLTEGQSLKDQELQLSRPGELRFSLTHDAKDVHLKWKQRPSNNGWGMGASDNKPFSGGELVEPNAEGVYIVTGLEPDRIAIKLRAAGYAETTFEILKSHRDGEDADLGALTLERGAVINGRIVNGSGAGVEGAKLSVELQTNNPGNAWFSRFGEDQGSSDATSGEDGSFALSGAPAGEYSMTITHVDYAEKEHRFKVQDASDVNLGNITIDAGGSVNGSVRVAGAVLQELRENGEGTSATVALLDASTPFLGMMGDDQLLSMLQGVSDYQTQSNPDGSYLITKVADGTYLAVAAVGNRIAKKSGVQVKAGESVLVDFEISSGVRVSGRITDHEGKGVANAEISLGRNLWSAEFESKTDGQGYYSFDDIPSGTWYLRMDGDGQRWDESYRAKRAVKVEDNLDTTFNLKLEERGLRLFGKVTIGGETLFSRVDLHRDGSTMPTNNGEVKGDGSFEVVGLEPGEYELWFQQTGMRNESHAYARITIPKGESEVEFNKNFESVSLTGRITGADESGLANSSITLTLQPEGALSDSTRWRQVEISCNAQGEFSRDHLVPGRYTITARAKGYGSNTETHQLSAPQADITLSVGEIAGSIQVLISGVDGAENAREIAGTSAGSVTLVDSQGDEVSIPRMDSFVTTLVKGTSVNVSSLAPGTYTLTIDHPDYELITVNATVVSEEATVIEVQSVRAASIELEVMNPELSVADIKAGSISVKDVNGNPVDTSGSFFSFGGDEDGSKIRLVRVRKAGTYSITLNVNGYEQYTADVSVPRSTNLRQSITLIAK